MLKSKLSKRLTASAAALAMVASASASSLASLTAYAGMQLGEGTFENGAGLPWHICENGTGQMAFSISDGVYSILVKNPGGASNSGEDRWDCQFRHRGITLTYGNTYRLTYAIYTTDNSGYGNAYAKIGDINIDSCEYWHGNGTKLDIGAYQPGMSMSDLESALRNASPTGENISYGEGWDKWKSEKLPVKEWKTFAYEFQVTQGESNGGPASVDGTAEWTFHFGGDGDYTKETCFSAGTILKFDNLALIDMSGDGNDYKPEPEKQMNGLVVNQLGYYPNLKKQATITVEAGAAPLSWSISGPQEASGTASETKFENAAGENCQVIDFSEVTTPGNYTLTCGGKSVPVHIGDDVYTSPSTGNTMLQDSLNYFYLNRSGIDIEDQYIQNGGKNASKSALARKAGHAKDEAYITDEWVFIYTEKTNSEVKSRYASKGTVDVTGGWYDAGDYGKYVVNGGVSMWTLANAYERNPEKFAEGASFISIPESGNGTPDILDELKWEADFFLKMTREDGLVYHKIHDYKWTALGVMPYDESTDEKTQTTTFPTRILKPVTYAATLNSAAALAQLARLLEAAGDSSAATYKAAAIKNYAAAKSAYTAKYSSIYADVVGDSEKDPMFAPLDQNKGGGPYGDTQVKDEFYWAACELYLATGDSEYYDDLKASPDAFTVTTNLVGGENKGSPTSWTWGTLASLGTASLAYNQDKLTDAEKKSVVEAFQQAGDFYLKVEDESMYGTSYPGCTYDATVTDINGDSASDRNVTLDNGYEWGSNSMVINNAMVMGMAYDLTGDVKYLSGATTAMDYILGRNPMENSYVTGYGTSTTENPHHRYWCHQLKNDWPSAPDGCLSGGPNSNMNDPMIQGAGYKIGELPGMKCYYDQVEAWSVNEITINWNSPLVWMSAFVEEEAPKAGEPSQEPTTEPSSEPTGEFLYGDVNCDGFVNVLDVLTLNKNLIGLETLSEQGKINANVDQDPPSSTPAPDATDSLNILKYVVKLITEFPVK